MDTTLWPQPQPQLMEGGGATIRRARPEKDQEVNCPRCNSTNTKFCYYNNYSLSQPRFFCKTCRRYWTEGGSLRNVPVGGGSRKNKRPSSSSSSSPSSKIIKLHHDHDQNPSKIQDLNLAYPPTSSHHHHQDHQNPNNTISIAPFMSVPGSGPTALFSPSGGMSFRLDGLGHDGGRIVFPFEDPNGRGHGDSAVSGYWSGMLGGGDGGSSW